MANDNSSNRPYEILIVEDNANDAELLQRALQKVQMDMDIEISSDTISNGVEAAAKIRMRRFDVIFLDMNLPPPDGLELTKEIRASAINRNTPIVILTGAEDRGLMTRVFQAGANLFLSKPIDRMKLQRLISVARTPIDRERRRLHRFKVKCKVTIDSGKDRTDGETVDLSLNGMLVQAKRVLFVGTAVNVSIVLPRASEPIRMDARIVRVVGSEFMGVQFEKIGKTESDVLGEFLIPFIVAAEEGKAGQGKGS